jgi:hypothetical protein
MVGEEEVAVAGGGVVRQAGSAVRSATAAAAREEGRRRDMGWDDGTGGEWKRWGREGAEIFDEAMNRGRRRCVRACGIHGQET